MLHFTPLWLLMQQVGRSCVREWCLEGRLGGTFYSSLFLSRYYQYYGTLAVKSTVWSVFGQWVSACAPRAPCAVLWKPTLQDCIGREPAASLGRTLDGGFCTSHCSQSHKVPVFSAVAYSGVFAGYMFYA